MALSGERYLWRLYTQYLSGYHELDEAGLGEHYGRAKCTLCQRYVDQCLATEVKVSQRYESGGKGTTQT